MPRKWANKADYTRQDVWLTVSNMIPNQRGNYMTANAGVQVTGAGPATPGTTLRAWCSTLPSGTTVGHVGTSTRLYSTTSAFSTFTDRSSGAYSGSTADWDFCQFGNFTLATNNLDVIQVRDASGVGNFAALGGTPPTTAKILVTQSGAVLAFNTNTGGQYWAASDVGNHANWTTGEAANGPINHRPGPITAAVAFQDVVIVAKASSVYRMRYVGHLVKWTVELLADGIGASGMHSMIVCGDVVMFCGAQGGTIFDGATFRGADTVDSGDPFGSQSIAGSVHWPDTRSTWFGYGEQVVIVWNHASERWGSFGLYYNTTTALSGYVLLTGSTSAIRVVNPSGEQGAYIVNLGANPCVLSLNGPWVSGVATSVATAMIGQFGTKTLFTRVMPRLVNRLFTSGSAWTSTQGSLGVGSWNAPMDGTSVAVAFSPVTSSGTPPRFDFMLATNFAQFSVSSTTSAFEIADLIITSKPVGTA